MIKVERQAPTQAMPSATGTGQMAVIASHFNFAQFDRPRQNLCRFARQMHALRIPFFGVELYEQGTRPFTEKWQNWQQFEATGANLMFQKEALLNIAEKMVPDWHDIIAWIDPDVAFDGQTWDHDAVEIINSGVKVVQLFDTAKLTNRDGTIFRTWRGCCYEKPVELLKAHTGFAWAAHRDLWRTGGGLWPFSITGSGDVVMASAFMNQPLREDYLASTGDDETHRSWRARMCGWCDSFSHVAGTLFHEWHGDIKERDYSARRDALKNFRPAQHIRLDSRGVLEWNRTTDAAGHEIRRYLSRYFQSRKED